MTSNSVETLATPDISVVIVSFNTAQLTMECLRRVVASEPVLNLEIIVVDNASIDDTVSLIRSEFPTVKLLVNSSNVGFGRANNQGLTLVSAPFVLLLNSDCLVAPGVMSQTLDAFRERPRLGALGVCLTDEQGSEQPTLRYDPTPFRLFTQRLGVRRILPMISELSKPLNHGLPFEACDWITGCYMLLATSVAREMGLFDERFFLYSEEVDLCLRLRRRGYQIGVLPRLSVVHLGGVSARSEAQFDGATKQISPLQNESELQYFRKHGGVFWVLSHLALTALGDAMKIAKRPFKFLRFRDRALLDLRSMSLMRTALKNRLGAVALR